MNTAIKNTPGSNRHLIEIERNRKYWRQKPLLQKVYKRFYAYIAERLISGRKLELGSGIGQIKESIPDCVTSDLFQNPGVDRLESAYFLSFPDGSLSNIILFDVWHHLEYPGAALSEIWRVLAPGGRAVIFDPAMGLIPRIIYSLFHHEPLGFGQPIHWQPSDALDLKDAPYFAAQARAWRIFYRNEDAGHLVNWNVLECTAWSDFAYLGSGGFSKPSMYPEVLLPWLETLDRWLTRISRPIFASRVLIVLEKK
jgi:SAM-dependent methyltransferase